MSYSCASVAFLLGVLLAAAAPQQSLGFSAVGQARSFTTRQAPHAHVPASRTRVSSRSSTLPILSASSKGGSEDENVEDDGMTNAFKALDGLSADDFADDTDLPTPPPKSSDNNDRVEASFDGAPEEEIEMYKKMYNELESEGDVGIYDVIREEMGGGSAGGAPYKSIEEAISKETSILDDTDGIGARDGADTDEGDGEKLTIDAVLREAKGEPPKPDMEKFMEQAVSEALEEARQQSPDVPASIRDDEELMKEINEIFDKANDKLMESVKELKAEQDSYVQKESEDRADIFKESEQRLADAQESVSRLMGTVSKETSEVERALADLEKERSKLDSNPLSKIADLKEQGIVKQASFVGLVLFSLRSVTEILQMAGPNPEAHATAAAIQGVIALACGAYFLLF